MKNNRNANTSENYEYEISASTMVKIIRDALDAGLFPLSTHLMKTLRHDIESDPSPSVQGDLQKLDDIFQSQKLFTEKYGRWSCVVKSHPRSIKFLENARAWGHPIPF
jgi:hypothetical protein